MKSTSTTCAHSFSLLDPSTGKSAWVGPPVGYLIQMEDGFKIYALGDTGLHIDMKLVGDYYKPDAVLVPFSNAGFVMDAEQAAYAVTELIKPRYVIPFHDFPSPKDAADPEAIEAFLKDFPSSYSSIGVAQQFLEIMSNVNRTREKCLRALRRQLRRSYHHGRRETRNDKGRP